MPSYLTSTITKHRWLFAAAIMVGGFVGAAVWVWGGRTPADPFAKNYTRAELDERIARGSAVFTEQNCTECHATTRDAAGLGGAAYKGPPLVGIVGQDVTLEDGRTLERDHRYLRRAIRDSSAQIVKGYAFQIMPDYGFLDDEDVGALLLYLRSLGEDELADAATDN